MTCTKCGEPDAVALINSILCPNKKCNDFDQRWSDEVSANKKEAAKKTVKEAADKVKTLKKDRAYILDSFGNKIFLLEKEGDVFEYAPKYPLFSITLPAAYEITYVPTYYHVISDYVDNTVCTEFVFPPSVTVTTSTNFTITWTENTDFNAASPW